MIRARNGAIVRLAPPPAAIIDDVPVGRLYRDGAIITRADDGQVRERRKLSFAGSVSVSLVLSDKGMLLADPEVALSGIPGTDSNGRLEISTCPPGSTVMPEPFASGSCGLPGTSVAGA